MIADNMCRESAILMCTCRVTPVHKVLTALYLQDNAEDAVRQMLIEFSEEQDLPEVGTVIAEDQMDDGTPIRVCQLPL